MGSPISWRGLLVALGLVVAIVPLITFGIDAAVEVEAEGVAAIEENDDTGRVEDEALRDAWRRAVEIGVGLVLRADLYVANKQVITQEIRTNVQGYIQNYEILSRAEVGGLYRIVIRASVDMLAVGETLDDLGLEIESIGNPRVVVVIKEWNLGIEQPFSVAEAAIRAAFLEKGFTVLRYEGMADDPRIRQVLDGSQEAAVDIARAFDADITIAGSVRTDPVGQTTIGSNTWHTAIAYGDFSVVLRDTGQAISSLFKEETEKHLSMEAAGTAAIEDVTESSLPQLLVEAIAGLNYSRGTGIRSLKLLVHDVKSFSQADAIRAALESLREAAEVELRTYDEGLASLDIVFLGPSDALARELEAEYFTAQLRERLGRSCLLMVLSLDFGVVEARLTRC